MDAGFKPYFRRLDEHASCIYLNLPREKIILLQGFFELYDGLGTVRTVNSSRGLLCVLTSNDSIEDCCGLLTALEKSLKLTAVTSEIDPLN